MEATRQRIVEATIELHGTVGPARTTIMGIAALAGVQRNTVYRHFPTDDELLAACSSRYWSDHPHPDPAAWRGSASSGRSFEAALAELYEHYSDVEAMLANVLRDAAEDVAIEQSVASYTAYLDQVAGVLIKICAPPRGRRRFVEAAVRHAVAFGTWQSLVRASRLSGGEAARLMRGMVDPAAKPRS